MTPTWIHFPLLNSVTNRVAKVANAPKIGLTIAATGIRVELVTRSGENMLASATANQMPTTETATQTRFSLISDPPCLL